MSDVDAILAGVIDADEDDAPVGFAEWIAQQREASKRKHPSTSPDSAHTGQHPPESGLDEYDLNDLLGGQS